MPPRRCACLVICAMLLWASVSEALFGAGDVVFDPTNYVENLATAISTAGTLEEAILITQNTLLNIESLNELIISSSSFASELETLWQETQGLVSAMQRLSNQFETLFSTEHLPLTAYWYSVRRTEIYQYKKEAGWYANRVQLLIGSIVKVFERLGRWIRSIPGLVGNKQAQLTTLQTQMDIVRRLEQSEVRQAALDHLQVIDALDQGSAIESLKAINEDAWKNWPGR